MINYIYKKRLQWINQVQLFRNELADIRYEVLNGTQAHAWTSLIQTDAIIDTIGEINQDLDDTDVQLLTSLNEEKQVWTGHCAKRFITCVGHDIDSNLLKRMKGHFLQMLNFQRSVELYLSQLSDGNTQSPLKKSVNSHALKAYKAEIF